MKNIEYSKEKDGSVYNKQIQIPRGYQDDVIDGIFKIHLNSMIEDLSSEFCKYFMATNIQNNKEYFAIVFEKEFNISIDLLDSLKSSYINGLNNLITYSIVTLSSVKESYLVAIVEKYNFSSNLTNYIEKNGALSYDQLEKKLIPTITEILSHCKRIGISCGNINPSNIICLDNGQFMLKEFIDSYQGFYQSNYYLSPEMAECIELGRYSNRIAPDIYAMGMTVFYAISAAQPWADYKNIDQYNEDRFENTTFKLLINKRKIPDNFRTFLKWTLHDDSLSRWKINNIYEWLAGNAQKPGFERLTENTNMLAFNGRNYSNLKSISYALFCNWDEALHFIQDDRLLKWMQRHNLDKTLISEVEKITGEKQLSKSFLFNAKDLNDKLTDILSVIDPQGPIRQRGIAFFANSIPNILHHFLIKNKKQASDRILKTLQNCNIITDIDKQTQNMLEFLSSDKIYMYELERIVYKINHNTICLSPILSSEYVTNLSDLLVALDKIAIQMPSKFNIDRNILSFIMARIDIPLESSIKILNHFPKFSDNPYIYGLCLLNVVQQHIPEVKIPNLCNLLAIRIVDLFNLSLHNVKFKNQLGADLIEASSDGNLSKILGLLKDQTRFINDYNGYYQACKELDNIKKTIRSLTFDDFIFENALLLGQKLTVLLSYLLCFIVTIILIM